MTLDAWLGAVPIATSVTLLLAFLLLAWWRHRPRYDRVEKQEINSPLGKRIMEAAYWSCLPVGRRLAALGVSPDAVSLGSLATGVAAGVAFAFGQWGLGALCFYLSGIMDVLDGLVARLSDHQTTAGSVLDSSLDRYVDFAVLAGIAVHYRTEPLLLLVTLLSIHGSYMVSYSTAKAEALGIKPPRGAMKRTERGPLIVLGAALSALSVPLVEPRLGLGSFHGLPMILVLVVIAIFSNLSAVQRLLAVAHTAPTK